MRNLLPLLVAVAMLGSTGIAMACPGEKDCDGKACGDKKSTKKSKHSKKDEAAKTNDTGNAETAAGTTTEKKEDAK